MDELVIGVLITGAILITLCIVLGRFKICCRSSHPSDPKTQLAYPVAISNRLFNDSEIGKDLPCLHCQLIEMGEMACYQDFCPHCGRIPPNLEGNFRRLVVLEQKQEKIAKKNQQQLQCRWQHLQQQKQGLQLQQQNHPDQIRIVGEKNQRCNQAEV